MNIFDYKTNDCELLNKPNNSNLDSILGFKFQVPNTHTFVRLVDYLGNEDSILRFARVSYSSNKEATPDYDKDQGLLRYLLRHKHTSPFESCELVLHLSMPIFVARQWIRHRTASLNEISGRYSKLPDDMFVISSNNWRTQSNTNKQGSEGLLNESVGRELSKIQEELHKHTRRVYEDRISKGVAKEIARIDLPVSQYTEMYWKCDLHNLLHFLKLRTDSHAQKEIRDPSDLILGIVELGFPRVVQAWKDYNVNSVTYTANDVQALQRLKLDPNNIEELRSLFPTKREYEEFLIKLESHQF